MGRTKHIDITKASETYCSVHQRPFPAAVIPRHPLPPLRSAGITATTALDVPITVVANPKVLDNIYGRLDGSRNFGFILPLQFEGWLGKDGMFEQRASCY